MVSESPRTAGRYRKGYTMPDTEYELIKGALASGVDAVERIERFAAETATADDYEHYGVEPDEDEIDSFAEVLDYAVLEVVTVSERSWGQDLTSPVAIRLLLTYGGPNVTATYRHNGYVTVDAYWGTDEGHGRAYAPETARILFDIADEVGS